MSWSRSLSTFQLAQLQRRLASGAWNCRCRCRPRNGWATAGSIRSTVPAAAAVDQQAIGDQLVAKMLLAGEIHDGDVVPVNVSPDGDSLILDRSLRMTKRGRHRPGRTLNRLTAGPGREPTVIGL